MRLRSATLALVWAWTAWGAAQKVAKVGLEWRRVRLGGTHAAP